MNKVTKNLLITALVLILVGGAAFTVLLARCDWDLTNLSGGEVETHEYAITEGFDTVKIFADTADILFLPSEDGICRVVTRDHRDITYTPTVEDGTLRVGHSDERAWYDHITFFGGRSTVTVYLPAGEYAALTVDTSTGDVEIPRDFTFGQMEVTLSTGDVTCSATVLGKATVTASTGDITLADLSAGELALSVSTGDITLSGVTCGSLVSKGNTGDIRLTGTLVAGTLSIERSTGDVTLDGCDAAEVFIKTSTGDVGGRFLTDKVFLVDTSTGDREVPRTTSGGRCEIITSSGDIYFREP
ncbi:MAG: DUF4097 family beta strand repeat protein [Clostridia bacterium]|nr:DUF4097 family beta strand repeat protein [Clostridia bacterium]